MDMAFGMPCRVPNHRIKRNPVKKKTPGIIYRKESHQSSRKTIAWPQNILVYASLNENANKLKERCLEWLRNSHSITASKRLLIGLVGVPGSGKTTLATRTCSTLNSIEAETCVVVPMDGFHYKKQILDEMENSGEAHARRGAPWTFDSYHFVQTIEKIRNNEDVFLPWFDHRKGDPDDKAVYVNERVPVVIVEGNYLLLPDKPWCTLSNLLDEVWYLDCDVSEAMGRVYERMVHEVGMSPGEACFRVSYNDSRNAELISRFKSRANVILDSSA